MKSNLYKFTIFIICIFLVSCSFGGNDYPSDYPDSPAQTREEVLYPQFQESAVVSDGMVASIDYSNINQGYVGAKLLQESSAKVKIQISVGDMKYHYDISKTEYVALPLQMGNGTYTFKILQNIEGTEYAVLASESVEVAINDNKLVYLYPNQIVDYKGDSKVVDLSFKLTKDDNNDLKRIKSLYEYVVSYLKYDNEKAKYVSDKYVLPVLDEAIDTGYGICFDYASLLAALCRIQGIPAKVICGYTEIEYHAWVEIYIEGKGWINPKVEFEAEKWTLLDPTFAASNGDYEGSYEKVYEY